jgi:RNA exonuclease 4
MDENWKKLINTNKRFKNQSIGKNRKKKEVVVSLEKLNGFTEEISKQRLEKAGKYVALDCEMVGVGFKGSQSVLARVSVVNFHLQTLLDVYVLPQEEVTDYRTKWSGITPDILRDKGIPFKDAVQQVADLIKDKVLIGHALQFDFSVLLLSHPYHLIRDTSSYSAYRHPVTNKSRSLKSLAEEFLNRTIQKGSHSSVEDACTTMELYKRVKSEWEQAVWKRKSLGEGLGESVNEI